MQEKIFLIFKKHLPDRFARFQPLSPPAFDPDWSLLRCLLLISAWLTDQEQDANRGENRHDSSHKENGTV